MFIPESLLDIRQHSGSGYLPLIDYGAWRVAVMRYADALLPTNLDSMQRHNETDEVFVLLTGRCILFVAEGHERVSAIYAEDLAPLKLYNVKRGCWHTHALSPDASVLIVENADTSALNSTKVTLSVEQRESLLKLTSKLWPEAPAMPAGRA
jgi:hypothetical protein